MEYLLFIPVFLALAAIPSFIWPVYRAIETEQVGYILEKLILGFWFQVGNLSNRKNSLDFKLDKLTKEVGKVKKQLRDEEKALKNKVDVITHDYVAHLLDNQNKRTWRYWFRKFKMPSQSFVKKYEKEQKDPDKRRVTYFTLENCSLPDDWVHEKDKGRRVKRFVFHDNSKNQQQNNNQRKKGNNNQNQNGNNNQNN